MDPNEAAKLALRALLVFGCSAVFSTSARAAPETSNKEEAALSEASEADSSLGQAGVSSLVRAKIKSALRAQTSRLPCSSAQVLCSSAQGSVIVLPGAVITGDVINAPGTTVPCPRLDKRCNKPKP